MRSAKPDQVNVNISSNKRIQGNQIFSPRHLDTANEWLFVDSTHSVRFDSPVVEEAPVWSCCLRLLFVVSGSRLAGCCFSESAADDLAETSHSMLADTTLPIIPSEPDRVPSSVYPCLCKKKRLKTQNTTEH